MSVLRIELDDAPAVFRPGETIRGRAVWQLDTPPEDLEVRLFWYTEGKGDQDVGVVERLDLDPGRPSGEEEFEFEVPWAPLSFSGQLISLAWAIELVANPGAWTGRVDLVVGHGDREIDIRADPPKLDSADWVTS